MNKVLVLLFGLFISACHQDIIYLSEQDNERNITMNIGQVAVITLAENPTTGYNWILKITPENQNIIGPIKEKYIHQETKLVGSGGIKEFSFKAVNIGNVDLYGYYQRPWEKLDESKLQSVHYTISVK